MKSDARTMSPAFGLVIAVMIGLMTWSLLDRYLTGRALAAHMESGKAYAARVLEKVAVLPDELRESSGLAVSRRQPGVLWSHNDSGDAPSLYAIDLQGRLLAIISIATAAAQDWEDMASGPCPVALSATSCLYLADIGDNESTREAVAVYVVVEPLLGGPDANMHTAAARSFRYRYPDGPRDSEALAVRGNGDVTIVSKGRTGTIDFFGISGINVARALTSGELLRAEYQGNSGIEPNERIGRLVTGAALSLDGTTLAVRTYNEVFFYGAVESRQDGSRWHDLRRPCFLGDAEPQGEAIDYLDQETLLLTSERARGRPGVIHRLHC